MKKLYVLLACSVFSTLGALPIGNTNSLDTQFGFEGNYVFNRRLMITKSESETPKTEIYTNSAKFSYAYKERIELGATIGATDLRLNTHFAALSSGEVGNENLFLETNSSLSYSLALRAKAWTFYNITTGFEAEYFSANPKIHTITDPVFEVIEYPNAHINYKELQLGCALSMPISVSDFATFIPYAGIKLSRVNATFTDTSISILDVDIPLTNMNMKQDRTLGYAIGATLFNEKIWNITAEGRFSDETAFSISTNLIF